MRAQANLPALVVALVLLTTVTTLSVGFADSALADADRTPALRHAADATADRLVAVDSPLTLRAGVLNGSQLGDLSADDVGRLAPVVQRRDVRISLDDELLVRRGTPASGVTARRGVRVVTYRTGQRTVNLSTGRTMRLPRRVVRATIDVDTGPNETVTAVRADQRVVLHSRRGLEGTSVVHVAPVDPAVLRFDATPNSSGNVTVTYVRRTATPRTLEVTVDE